MKNVKLMTTSILVFCLIYIQLLPIVSYAEETANQNKTSEKANSGSGAMDALGGLLSMAANSGLSASTGSHSTGGIQEILTGLSVSVVNLSLKNCQGRTTDILAAMSASGVNLVGQMMATGTNAEAKSAQIKYSGNSTETTAAIQSQIKSLEDTKEALETKQKFEKGTVAAYLVASGLALAGKVAVTYLEKACKAGAEVAEKNCSENAKFCDQWIAKYQACISNFNRATVDGCRDEDKQRNRCKSFVLGSVDATDAKNKLIQCGNTIRGTENQLIQVDNSLSFSAPSTTQAIEAERNLENMKNINNVACGKSELSSAGETTAEGKKAVEEALAEISVSNTMKGVLEAAGDTAPKLQEFISLDKTKPVDNSKGLSQEQSQIVDSVAAMNNDQREMLRETLRANNGKPAQPKKSLCSYKGTVICTIFAEGLKNSLAKCSQAITSHSVKTLEEKKLLAQEEAIKKGPYAKRYQYIKNIVLSAFTGDNSYLEENFMSDQEEILMNLGFGTFVLTLPASNVHTFDQYLNYHEKMGIINGRKESISSLTYNDYRILFDGLKHEAKYMIKVAAEKGIDLFIPSAQALALTNMIGAALNLGGSTGLLNQITGTQGTFIDGFMVTYGKRSIVFGASSALLGAAAAATGKNIDDVQKDIDKLKKMKAEVDKAAANQGGGGGGGGGESPAGGGEQASTEPEKLAQNEEASVKNAASESPSSPDYDKIKLGKNKDLGLGSKTLCITPNCAPMKDMAKEALMGSGIGTGIPQSTATALAKGLKLASEIADGIQGKNKISASTLDKLDELGKQKNALQKHINGLQRQINNQLKADGQPPIDFEKLENKMAGKLAGDTSKAIGASGMEMENISRDLHAGARFDEKAEAFSTDYKEEQGSGGGGNRFAAFKGSDDALNSGEAQNPGAIDQKEYENDMKPFVNDSIDIVSDTGVPIWRIITTRYVRSGLKRLNLKPDDE